MPRYTVIPRASEMKLVEVDEDASDVILSVIARLGCNEARVLVNGKYRFTVGKYASGVWRIWNEGSSP